MNARVAARGMRGVAAAVLVLMLLAGCIRAVPDEPGAEPAPHPSQTSTRAPQQPGNDGPASPSASASSTAPKPKDTDGDGFGDKAEKENGTDPKDPDDQPYVVPGPPQLDARAIVQDLRAFAAAYGVREGNAPTHRAARDWMAGRMADAGLEVWRQDFSADGLDQQNVIGIRWGLERDAWIVVGAHYDTTTTASVDRSLSQGIYDDGSGTMMAIHLGLAYANLTMPYTIVVAAFDGEERGLEGSQAFLEAMLTGGSPYPSAQVVGVVNLDMFGLNWPGTGAPMVLTTNSVAVRDAVEAARLQQGVPDPAIVYDKGLALGSSDYATFFAQEIATGFFISDFERLGAPLGLPASTPQGAYPFWHVADRWETMVAMAGDEEHVVMGFQAGVDLAGALLHHFATAPAPLEAGTSAV